MDESEVDDAINRALSRFGDRSFSTAELIGVLRADGDGVWQGIIERYGAGGRGSGRYYSAFSFVAQRLDKLSRQRELAKLDYRPAPKDWGNPVIRYWTKDRAAGGGTLYPDQVSAVAPTLTEGAITTVVVNRYERDRKAREQCIEHHGVSCLACGFDFEATYGEHGAGFIHVHHLVPLSEIGSAHEVDPVSDLVPLCPNCHAMVHYGPRMLSIEALRALLAASAG